jgi:long-chain acyl-CoA synthetase
MRIGDLLTRAARCYPEKEAVVFEKTRLTYRQINERTNRLAAALLDMGVKRGDRVGVICHNSHNFTEIFFACAKIGAASTNLNWRLSPRELAFLINDAGPDIVFFSKRFEYLFDPMKADLKNKHRFVAVDGVFNKEMIDYEKLIAKYKADEPRVTVAEDDTALLLYTSGTTGRPKGVMLTHKNMMANCVSTIIEMEMTRDWNILGLLPIFHVGIFVLIDMVWIGAKVTYVHSFDPAAIFEIVQKEKTTVTAFTPVIFKFLLDHPDIDKYDLSSLKTIIYATAPMPVELLKRSIKRFDCDFIQFFGMTETSPTLTMLVREDHVLDGPEYKVKWLGSAGRPVSNVQVRVVNEKGKDCAPGVIGEIIGKGENVMKGYYNMPEATAEAIRDGWYYSGDMGYFDEYGYLFIADRKKDMIISGGENIYPREVEEAIQLIPGVADVSVIGVPDDTWGEAVKAIVVRKPGAELTEAMIIEHCKKNIASYKKPKSVDFVDALPRSAMGKVLKHELREPFWKGRERKI